MLGPEDNVILLKSFVAFENAKQNKITIHLITKEITDTFAKKKKKKSMKTIF